LDGGISSPGQSRAYPLLIERGARLWAVADVVKDRHKDAVFAALRPLLFALDPEVAHGVTLAALKSGLVPAAPEDDPILATTLAGLALPNPVGLAAGFDKDAEVPDAMLRLGFGFVECGSVCPRPQPGNPKPRLFRLVEDRAVINRFGFNSKGVEFAHARLSARAGKPGVVGINLGANKDSEDRTGDYVTGLRALAPLASYVTVNISSPNTPGLRALQDGAALADLIARVMAARGSIAVPVFVKVAPDQGADDWAVIARACIDGGIDGLIVSNTTVSRPALASRFAGETGGLSGAPLKPLALAALTRFRAETGGALPLVAVGGIASGADAYARIRAGASAVQLYSALVYEGPGLVQRIKAELAALLRRDGFANVAAAVGA
jgi:dihydroorotate dehydrogenase